MDLKRTFDLCFKRVKPTTEEAKLMDEILKETEQELKDIQNRSCLNNNATHFCYTGGSQCCYNLSKTHYCHADGKGCVYH